MTNALHKKQQNDRSSDNRVSEDELLVAWDFGLPIKNNEPEMDKWKKNVYQHYCTSKEGMGDNKGCTFRQFVDLLEEMFEVHLRNTMRNQIKALYRSLKIMVRFFYSAAETTGEGECPVKLPMKNFLSLFHSLFECKKKEGDKETDCVGEDFVRENIQDKQGLEDSAEEEEGDKCRVEIEGDQKKQLTLEKFEEVILNQKFHEIVFKAIEDAKKMKNA